jgi:hypothetical protein
MEKRLSLESQMDKVIWAFYGKAKRKDVLSSKYAMQLSSFGQTICE